MRATNGWLVRTVRDITELSLSAIGIRVFVLLSEIIFF